MYVGNRARKRADVHVINNNILRFKLFLHRGINTVDKSSCTRNPVCMNIRCTVVIMHAICEGLMLTVFHRKNTQWENMLSTLSNASIAGLNISFLPTLIC